MISKKDIDELLLLIDEEKKGLDHYTPSNPEFNSEAYLSLMKIEAILLHSDDIANEPLIQLLRDRWQAIASRDCQYLHDFSNPANRVCHKLATLLSQETNINALCLLMPTIAEVKPESYISSSYIDEDLNLKEWILSDDNQRLICIPEALEFAQEDAILKHSSLVEKKVKLLSHSEINRLKSRHPSVQATLDCLTERALYRLEGDTVGAALTRLIDGLLSGGVHSKTRYKGSEFNSGIGANVAIVEFSQYLETLAPEIYEQLMSAEKVDRYNDNMIQGKSIRPIWETLSNPTNQKNQDAAYCVEMLARYLDEILEQNPGLYDLVSYEGSAAGNIAQLNENYMAATTLMKEQLKTIETHPCYPSDVSDLRVYLVQEFKHHTFPIRAMEIRWLLKMLSSDEESIHFILKNRECNLSELRKLNPEEKKLYLLLKPQQLVTNSAVALFKTKRKIEREGLEENKKRLVLG